MRLSFWFSIGAGALLMAGHAALRVLTHRLALDRSTRKAFLLLELGGLGARMALVFGAVALVLLSVPVHEKAFVGTVLVLLVLSMGLETRFILRRMDQGALRP